MARKSTTTSSTSSSGEEDGAGEVKLTSKKYLALLQMSLRKGVKWGIISSSKNFWSLFWTILFYRFDWRHLFLFTISSTFRLNNFLGHIPIRTKKGVGINTARWFHHPRYCIKDQTMHRAGTCVCYLSDFLFGVVALCCGPVLWPLLTWRPTKFDRLWQTSLFYLFQLFSNFSQKPCRRPTHTSTKGGHSDDRDLLFAQEKLLSLITDLHEQKIIFNAIQGEFSTFVYLVCGVCCFNV